MGRSVWTVEQGGQKEENLDYRGFYQKKKSFNILTQTITTERAFSISLESRELDQTICDNALGFPRGITYMSHVTDVESQMCQERVHIRFRGSRWQPLMLLFLLETLLIVSFIYPEVQDVHRTWQ